MLDTTREVEDSDTRDTEGSKQHFTVFVPELIMIAGERQAGADAQAINVLSAARSPTTVADTGQRMGRSEVREGETYRRYRWGCRP